MYKSCNLTTMGGGRAIDMGTYQTPNMDTSKDIKYQIWIWEHTSKICKKNPNPQPNFLRFTI